METQTIAGLGEYLRAEREKRHITIEQVASATKINVKLLHALENDNYDALPAKPFVRGFVTSYTRYVGLDCDEILTRFDDFLDEKSGKKFKRPADAPHIFVGKEGQTDNSKTILTVVMVGFLMAALVIFAVIKPSLKHKRGRGKEKTVITNDQLVTVPPPPSEDSPSIAAPAPKAATKEDEIKEEAAPKILNPPAAATPAPTAKPKATPTPTPAPTAKPTPKPTPTPVALVTPPEQAQAQAAPATETKPRTSSSIPEKEVKYRLVVRALEDSWVKYQADDFNIMGFTLKKDKKIFIRARSSIRFTTGYPKGLEISFDNRNFRPMDSNSKLIVVPSDLEGQFKNQPFITPTTP